MVDGGAGTVVVECGIDAELTVVVVGPNGGWRQLAMVRHPRRREKMCYSMVLAGGGTQWRSGVKWRGAKSRAMAMGSGELARRRKRTSPRRYTLIEDKEGAHVG
jgi:hypothetical protein